MAGLDRAEVGREAAEGMQAPALPQHALIGEEADLVLLCCIEHLQPADPAHERLEAGRVHELELAEIHDDLGHHASERTAVHLLEKVVEWLLSTQIRRSVESDRHFLAVGG